MSELEPKWLPIDGTAMTGRPVLVLKGEASYKARWLQYDRFWPNGVWECVDNWSNAQGIRLDPEMVTHYLPIPKAPEAVL